MLHCVLLDFRLPASGRSYSRRGVVKKTQHALSLHQGLPINWISDTVNGYIIRVHNKRRTQLFVPSNTVQLFGDGSIDLNVCRICSIGSEYQTDSVWTGKTYFFMRGAGEADLEIEAKEIRDNLTDFDYIGNERIGNENVTLINNGSFEGIFLEDNQATIRILESGRSVSSFSSY